MGSSTSGRPEIQMRAWATVATATVTIGRRRRNATSAAGVQISSHCHQVDGATVSGRPVSR